MLKTNRVILMTSILLIINCISSQELVAQESDANVWSRLAIKYDLNSLTRISVEEEFRFFDNVSQLEQNHTEIGLSRELNKRWNGGVFYRFIYETNTDRDYSLGHRGWVQLEYQLLDSDINVYARTRLQTTFKDIQSSSSGKVPDWYNRYKISAEYKTKGAKWIPDAGIEFWHYLNPSENPFVNKLRFSLGLEYRYTKKLRWQVFYSYQKELQVSNPDTDYIFGVACTYKIN